VVALASVAVLALPDPRLRGQVGGAGGGSSSTIRLPSAETAPEGTGAVTGTVIDGLTNAPVADTVVYLTIDGRGSASAQGRQLTDEKGRFAFVNLAAGNHLTVSASKPGYLQGGFNLDNRPGSSGGRLDLHDGEWIASVRLVLWRPGAISGTVVDERGEPIVDVSVRVLVQASISGRPVLAAGPVTRTDDRGVYRVADLAPGRYMVQVPSTQSSLPSSWSPPAAARGNVQPEPMLELADARLVLRNFAPPPPVAGGHPVLAYPATYFPGSTSVGSAEPVTLKFGEERKDVDIAVHPVSVWHVSGHVEGPAEARQGLMLRLLPQELDGLGYGSEAATALVGSDGRFTFLNVPSGTYVIDAPRTMNEIKMAPTSTLPWQPRLRPPAGGGGLGTMTSWLDAAPPGMAFETVMTGPARDYVGRADVTVAGDETDVVVTMRPTGTMSGRILVEPSSDAQSSSLPPGMVIQLDPASGNPALGLLRNILRPDGSPSTFTISGLLPGQYWLRTSTAWVIESIRWQGRDYTDAPFDAAATQDFADVEVTVTKSAAPVVSGIVRDRQGSPVADARVVAFPTDPALWQNYGLFPRRLKSTYAAQDGSYRLMELPAGQYFIAAFPPAASSTWYEPSFLEHAAASATQVALHWNEAANLDLRSVARSP
jgi:Carboxypeptidase regulatory-like domain